MAHELALAHARSEDAAELARLAALCFDDPWSERAFAEEIAREPCLTLVARTRGETVGYVLGWRVLDEAEVQSIAVAPGRRRRGVGRALLAEFCARQRASGARRVTLEVRRSNGAARALYERAGLAREGERPRYYRGGESAVLYGGAL